MKKKVFGDLKTKDIETLKKKVDDLEKEIINDLLELKMGKVQNVHATTNKKRDIARIKTLLKMKGITEKVTKVTKEPKDNKTSKNKKTVNAAS